MKQKQHKVYTSVTYKHIVKSLQTSNLVWYFLLVYVPVKTDNDEDDFQKNTIYDESVCEAGCSLVLTVCRLESNC